MRLFTTPETAMRTGVLLLSLFGAPVLLWAQDSGQRSSGKVSFGTIMFITVCILIATQVLNNIFGKKAGRTGDSQSKPETKGQNLGAEQDLQSGTKNDREGTEHHS